MDSPSWFVRGLTFKEQVKVEVPTSFPLLLALFSILTSNLTLLLQKIFPKYSLSPLIRLAEMLFIGGS
jgi:hypothetical protein